MPLDTVLRHRRTDRHPGRMLRLLVLGWVAFSALFPARAIHAEPEAEADTPESTPGAEPVIAQASSMDVEVEFRLVPPRCVGAKSLTYKRSDEPARQAQVAAGGTIALAPGRYQFRVRCGNRRWSANARVPENVAFTQIILQEDTPPPPPPPPLPSGADSASGAIVVNGTPPGALVVLEPGGASVALPGLFENLHEPRYILKTSAAGFLPDSREVALQPGERKPVTIDLVPAPATLRLEGTPPDSQITLKLGAKGFEGSGLPFGLASLPPGRYELTVSAPGHATSTSSLELAPGAREKRIIRLRRLGRLHVEGAPSDAVLELVGPGNVEPPAERRSTGLPASFVDLEPGRYQLSVTRHHFEPLRQEVEIQLEEEKRFPIAMQRTRGWLRGKKFIRTGMAVGLGAVVAEGLYRWSRGAYYDLRQASQDEFDRYYYLASGLNGARITLYSGAGLSVLAGAGMMVGITLP